MTQSGHCHPANLAAAINGEPSYSSGVVASVCVTSNGNAHGTCHPNLFTQLDSKNERHRGHSWHGRLLLDSDDTRDFIPSSEKTGSDGCRDHRSWNRRTHGRLRTLSSERIGYGLRSAARRTAGNGPI